MVSKPETVISFEMVSYAHKIATKADIHKFWLLEKCLFQRLYVVANPCIMTKQHFPLRASSLIIKVTAQHRSIATRLFQSLTVKMLARTLLAPMRRTLFALRTPARLIHTCTSTRPTLSCASPMHSLTSAFSWLRTRTAQGQTASQTSSLVQQTRGMKVRSSVKKLCDGCKSVRRKKGRYVYIICSKNPKHKQR